MKNIKYALGLDIGVASIGWAILDLDNEKIERLGVRIFEKPEDPQDGTSPAAARRVARGMRKRIGRRAKRMGDIRSLLVRRGVMPSRKSLDSLFIVPQIKTPYDLRAEGLDRRLAFDEWARVLLHIAKHRGFRSNRKNEAGEGEKAKESQKLLSGIESNKKLLEEGGYRSVGEMMLRDAKFSDHKRNKGGDYSHTLPRSLLLDEVLLLFDAQRCMGNLYADEAFEKTSYKMSSPRF